MMFVLGILLLFVGIMFSVAWVLICSEGLTGMTY